MDKEVQLRQRPLAVYVRAAVAALALAAAVPATAQVACDGQDYVCGKEATGDGEQDASGQMVEWENQSNSDAEYYGGKAYSHKNAATANGNTAKIKNSTIYNITGGEAIAEGGFSAANNNVVEAEIITAERIVGGDAGSYDGFNGEANENRVTIKKGTITGHVEGGHYEGEEGAGAGYALRNIVTISDSQVDDGASGGVVMDAAYGNASYNRITVIDSTVNDIIAGGYVDVTDEAHADHNTVTLQGNVTTNSSVGGGSIVNAQSPFAEYNTVNIIGPGTVKIGGDLFGGAKHESDCNGQSSTCFEGNTLNLIDTKNVSVGRNLGNFEFINFYLPETITNGDTVITVGNLADIRGSKIGVMVNGAAPTLAVGDKVTLIDASDLRADAQIKTRGLQGATIDYTFQTTAGRQQAGLQSADPWHEQHRQNPLRRLPRRNGQPYARRRLRRWRRHERCCGGDRRCGWR